MSALTPVTLQSDTKTEPSAAVVFSGDGQGKHGSLPVELYAPLTQGAAKERAHGIATSQAMSVTNAAMPGGRWWRSTVAPGTTR